MEILRKNRLHLVELDEDTSAEHLPHRSWGTYRVLERATKNVVYSSPNRDKAFGVFEYLAQQAGL